MKDDYKNMLLGYVAAKSQNHSQNNNLYYFNNLNVFQKIWISLFVWGIPLVLIVLATMGYMGESFTLLGINFEGTRSMVMSLILGLFIVYLWIKIIRRFPRFFFWITFGPFFFFLLMWLFVPTP
tara:strand:- start:15 stop:386 length:372 start_codon:yes stop_codon:yes gene_type:complete